METLLHDLLEEIRNDFERSKDIFHLQIQNMSYNDKIKYIESIMSVQLSFRNLDRFELGNPYVLEQIRNLKSLQSYVKAIKGSLESSTRVNYGELLFELKEFINNVKASELEHIITRKKLTDGAEKAVWIGPRVDAWRFAKYTHIKVSDFCKCIRILKGSSEDLKDKDRDKNWPQIPPPEIIIILNKYIQE